MPGFDGNDRQSESPLGYRADVLQPAVSSYNGYVFPPALNSGVTVVPEYDDSGRTVKYLTIAVSVSFIVTDMALYSYETANLSTAAKNSGMETVTKSLITRLSQPCQSLIFTARGYGDFVVNGPGGIRDVDYGPKPQVIELEPLGGSQAYRVEWLCVTRVPPCLRDVTGQLIQFNYSTSWSMNPSGFMIRTIEGSAELPRTRGYQTGGVHASDIIPYPADEFGVVKNKILKAFPMTPGFRRQVSYAWKESRKVIQFKIEDVEIRSDSPFLPGISDIDLTQSMSSSLEDGAFQKWKVAYSANIEVVNSKTTGGISEAKKIAWVWIGKFLQEKRKLFENTVNNSIVQSRTRPIPPTDDVDVTLPPITGNPGVDIMTQMYSLGKASEMAGYNTGAFIYPVHISITDSIYSNTINLTVAYVAVVTSDLLGQAVGLFEKVELKGLDNTSWVKYIDATNAHKESIHVAEPTEMIVDLCHAISAPASSSPEQTAKKSTKKTEPLLSVSLPEKEKSWEYYHNDFYFLDSQQNVIGQRLHGQTEATTDLFTSNQQESLAAEMANVPYEVGGYSEVTSSSDGEARKQVKVYSPSPTVCYIRMRGHASRFNGRINPPKLIGVGAGITINPTTGKGEIKVTDQHLGGALAHKYGDSMLLRAVVKTGLTDDNGNQIIKHQAAWSQTYVLDRAPSSGQMTTTGIPHRFQPNFDD